MQVRFILGVLFEQKEGGTTTNMKKEFTLLIVLALVMLALAAFGHPAMQTSHNKDPWSTIDHAVMIQPDMHTQAFTVINTADGSAVLIPMDVMQTKQALQIEQSLQAMQVDQADQARSLLNRHNGDLANAKRYRQTVNAMTNEHTFRPARDRPLKC